MNENDMVLVRDACQRYVVEWKRNNADLDDYEKMFNAVIATMKIRIED
jgi:hypothetical protein